MQDELTHFYYVVGRNIEGVDAYSELGIRYTQEQKSEYATQDVRPEQDGSRKSQSHCGDPFAN